MKKKAQNQYGKKTQILKNGKILKSGLEIACYNKLISAKIPFQYESETFTLIAPNQKYLSKEHSKGIKNPMRNVYSIQSTTYTPDFTGLYKGKEWIIETKGRRQADFNIKWKLFKQYLLKEQREVMLFMPSNNTEVDECIYHIINQDDYVKKKIIPTAGTKGSTKRDNQKVSRTRKSGKSKQEGSNPL